MTSRIKPAPKLPNRIAAPKVTGIWHAILTWMCRGCKTGVKAAKTSRNWHATLPLLMVIVATMGAFVAGAAAISEQEAHRLSRLLAWGHHLALTQRQVWLAAFTDRARVEERLNAYQGRGKSFLRDAKLLHDKNIKPETAAALDLLAQEELAAARALAPFRAVIPNPMYKNLHGLEPNLQKRVAFYLADRGFETIWHDPPATVEGKEEKPSVPPPTGVSPFLTPESSKIWDHLDKKLERAHEMVPLLAFGVALFVLPLFLFTIANTRCGELWKQRLIILGCLVAGGGSVFIVIVLFQHSDLLCDLISIVISQPLPQSLAFLLPPALLVLLFLVASVDLIRLTRSKPPKTNRRDGSLSSDLSAPGDPAVKNLFYMKATNGLSRCIVSLIAITVLCTALCGLGYSCAVSKTGAAAHEALKEGLEMHTRSSRLDAVTNVGLLLKLASIQEYRVRYVAASQGARRLKAFGEGNASLASDSANAYASIHNQSSELLRALRNHQKFGMVADKRFPEKLKWLWIKPESLVGQPFAMWDAFSQMSLTWHAKARIFLGILTVLAMAIYLFSQSHGMGEGSRAERLILYGFLLLIIGVVCGTMTQLSGPFETTENLTGESKEEKAAHFFATAQQKLMTAHDPEDFREVVPDLEKAVAYRPNFAQAHLELAYALGNAHSSQVGESYMSLPTKETLSNRIKHREVALKVLRANGYVEPAKMLNGLGFETLLLAFDRGDLKLVQQSIEDFTRAQKKGIDGGNKELRTLIRWHLALAQLASGKVNEVDADAARQMAETGDRDLIVSAFTDLEVLAKYYHRLHPEKDCLDAIKQAKQQFIGAWLQQKAKSSTTGSTVTESGDLTDGSATIDLSPYSVRWRGQLLQFQPQRDRLVLIWYQYDPQWQVWRALPEVSGPVQETDENKTKFLPGSWVEIIRPFMANTNWTRCLSSGLYRAELYINGRLTLHPTQAENPAGNFDPKRLFDLNVALCCPKNWTPIDTLKQLPNDDLLVSGYQTPEGKPAAFVFTFYAPRSVENLGEQAPGQKPVPEAVTWAKTLLVKGGWMKGAEVFADYGSPGSCDTTSPSTVLYKHWVTTEGVRHVGIVVNGAAPPRELCLTLDSMANLYKPVNISTSVK